VNQVSRRAAVLGALAAAACSRVRGPSSPTPAHELARGVAYTIDTTVLTRSTYDSSRPDPASAGYAAFQTYAARVEFANGRGRIDIVTRRAGPTIVADTVVPTTPLGMPGDYYLFDTSGFVLVHPSTRTFSSAAISHDAYGSYDFREGWPDFFEFQPSSFAPPSPSASVNAPLKDRVNIYWHTDSGRTGFARGRTAIDDVPLREMNIARWFGATRWLADIAVTGCALPTELTVTAAIPFRPPNDRGVPLSFVLKHAFSNAHVTDVDLSRLVLPAVFTRVSWPGDTRPTSTRALRNESRWLAIPRRAP
jgi:hypothetical protein